MGAAGSQAEDTKESLYPPEMCSGPCRCNRNADIGVRKDLLGGSDSGPSLSSGAILYFILELFQGFLF